MQFYIVTIPIDGKLGAVTLSSELFLQEIDEHWGKPDFLGSLMNHGNYERHGIIIKELSSEEDRDHKEFLVATTKVYKKYFDAENDEKPSFDEKSKTQIVDKWEFYYMHTQNLNGEVSEIVPSQLRENADFQPVFRAFDDGTFSLTLLDAADEITGEWTSLSEEECSKTDSVMYVYKLNTDYFSEDTQVMIFVPSDKVDLNGDASQMLLSIWSENDDNKNASVDLLFIK